MLDTQPAQPEIIDRFMAKISLGHPKGCWIWTGAVNSRGYGQIGAGRSGRTFLLHRWAYEFFVGPIPAGLTIDHLCETKRCANPSHLEPVTGRENTQRYYAGLRGDPVTASG